MPPPKEIYPFQSAPPVREATLLVKIAVDPELVSIRASREGGDKL